MGDWYCPTCDEYLSGARVTFSEHCDTCQTPVTVPAEGLVDQFGDLNNRYLNAESALRHISNQDCQQKVYAFIRWARGIEDDPEERLRKFWCECHVCVASEGLRPRGRDGLSQFRKGEGA